MTTLYKLGNIEKTINGKKILDITELYIEQNHIYGLHGPNGSGKTTLLNILAFLDPPTSGNVFFKGEKVTFRESFMQPLRKEVILVDQNPVLFSISVKKNVGFGLEIRGTAASEIDKIVRESLDNVGMLEFIDAEGSNLSAGETQRVAIARAIACSPGILLLDEPTSNIDLKNQVIIEEVIRNLNLNKKMTVIFSSHDPAQMKKLAQEHITLDSGLIR
ncbi:MAG: ABC transporter ATP-binding protein [Candidatus Riflebacteria bacterium]|nr:ABC transporter ATP-binding protein [Candidatus Riflebacteria bacterium]